VIGFYSIQCNTPQDCGTVYASLTMDVGWCWSSFLWPSARHQLTLRDNGYVDNHVVYLFMPTAFTGTHCAYPWRLSWPGWLVTYRDGMVYPQADGHPSKE